MVPKMKFNWKAIGEGMLVTLLILILVAKFVPYSTYIWVIIAGLLIGGFITAWQGKMDYKTGAISGGIAGAIAAVINAFVYAFFTKIAGVTSLPMLVIDFVLGFVIAAVGGAIGVWLLKSKGKSKKK